MYFYGLFSNSSDLYQLYSIYNFIAIFPFILSILTLRRIIAKINKISKFFLFSLLSLPLYVTILFISLFHLSLLLFFLGLPITQYASIVLSSYFSIIDYSVIPPEIEGYTISILSLREYFMRLFTSVFIAGYVIQYFGILTSVSIVIGTSAPLMLFFYFKTRGMKD